jgi:hypothetical protein
MYSHNIVLAHNLLLITTFLSLKLKMISTKVETLNYMSRTRKQFVTHSFNMLNQDQESYAYCNRETNIYKTQSEQITTLTFQYIQKIYMYFYIHVDKYIFYQNSCCH